MIDLKLLNFKNCHDLTCGFLSIFSKVFETKTSNYWEKNHVQKIKGWIEVTKLQDNWVSKLLNFKNTLIRYWTYSFFQDHFITINIIEHLLKERSKNILQEINSSSKMINLLFSSSTLFRTFGWFKMRLQFKKVIFTLD